MTTNTLNPNFDPKIVDLLPALITMPVTSSRAADIGGVDSTTLTANKNGNWDLAINFTGTLDPELKKLLLNASGNTTEDFPRGTVQAGIKVLKDSTLVDTGSTLEKAHRDRSANKSTLHIVLTAAQVKLLYQQLAQKQAALTITASENTNMSLFANGHHTEEYGLTLFHNVKSYRSPKRHALLYKMLEMENSVTLKQLKQSNYSLVNQPSVYYDEFSTYDIPYDPEKDFVFKVLPDGEQTESAFLVWGSVNRQRAQQAKARHEQGLREEKHTSERHGIIVIPKEMYKNILIDYIVYQALLNASEPVKDIPAFIKAEKQKRKDNPIPELIKEAKLADRQSAITKTELMEKNVKTDLGISDMSTVYDANTNEVCITMRFEKGVNPVLVADMTKFGIVPTHETEQVLTLRLNKNQLHELANYIQLNRPALKTANDQLDLNAERDWRRHTESALAQAMQTPSSKPTCVVKAIRSPDRLTETLSAPDTYELTIQFKKETEGEGNVFTRMMKAHTGLYIFNQKIREIFEGIKIGNTNFLDFIGTHAKASIEPLKQISPEGNTHSLVIKISKKNLETLLRVAEEVNKLPPPPAADNTTDIPSRKRKSSFF